MSHEKKTGNSAKAQVHSCQLCGKPLVLRTARKGTRAEKQFWGCSGYPACKGTREFGATGNPTDRADQKREDGQGTVPLPAREGDPQARARTKRLRPSGGYRTLRSFHVATIIYDATVDFCERFLAKGTRTHDQMVQAARSGRQNIAEGSRAAATSSQTELRLVNAARFSLEELLLDYEDFLRHRRKRQWEKDDLEALAVRAVGKKEEDRTDLTDPTDPACALAYAPWLKHADPAVVANSLLCLIHQANYLLDQLIDALERDFVEDGGYSEQLAAARIAERQRQMKKGEPAHAAANPASPVCPLCGKPMALRTARKGPNTGKQFWGCSGYPGCKGTLEIKGSDGSDGSDRSKTGKK
jgi:restriction system protein